MVPGRSKSFLAELGFCRSIFVTCGENYCSVLLSYSCLVLIIFSLRCIWSNLVIPIGFGLRNFVMFGKIWKSLIRLGRFMTDSAVFDQFYFQSLNTVEVGRF